MTALYIVTAVLLLLLLLLLMPVGIRLRYDGDFRAWVYIGPVPVLLYPRKEKPEKPGSEKKKGEPSKAAGKDTRKAGFSPIEILRAVIGETRRRRLTVRRLKFWMVCAGPDAAAAALLYGRMCVALGALLPLVRHEFRLKHPDIRLDVDYEKIRSDFRADVIITLSMGRALCSVYRIMKVYYAPSHTDNSAAAGGRTIRKQEASS